MNMFQSIKERVLLSVGIESHQSRRVGFSWGMRFLYQMGFVVAWTIITALFVNHFGIQNLILLFAIDALLMIGGTWISSFVFPRYSATKFLTFLQISTLVLLLAAFSVPQESFLFFLFLILGKDLFYMQLNTLLARQEEALFSPTEASKFLPIIESSLTIGMVVGAALAFVGLQFFNEVTILSIWAMVLILMLVATQERKRILHEVPHFHKKLRQKQKDNEQKQGLFALSWKACKSVKYIQHVLVIVVVQALIFTVIEYEFTFDLQSHIDPLSVPEESGMGIFKDLKVSLFQDMRDTVIHTAKQAKIGIQNIQARLLVREKLAEDLSIFHLFFGFVALLVQFVITPKVLRRLGVVGTMVSYIWILFVSFVGFLTGGMNIALVRTIQHGFHTLHESAYHISFYSLCAEKREAVRLFLEGLMRPLGILLAVGVLFFVPAEYIFWIGLGLTIFSIIVGYFMHHSFTHASRESVEKHNTIEAKIHALEVFAQRGHKNAFEVLSKELEKKDVNHIVFEKIIGLLTELNDPRIVNLYTNILLSKAELKKKYDVLESLYEMDSLDNYWKDNPFTKDRLIEALRSLLQIENNYLQKLLIMNLMKYLSVEQSVEFFQNRMDSDDDHARAICLRSCKDTKDPAFIHYVGPYLEDYCPRVRAHAVIALWNFENKKKLCRVLDELLAEDGNESSIAALYAIGEIKATDFIPEVNEYQESQEEWMELHAAMALLKIGTEQGINRTLELIIGDNEALSLAAFRMLKRVDPSIRRKIHNALQGYVSMRVNEILQYEESWNKGVLGELKRLYRFVHKYDDMSAVHELLQKIS